MYNLNDQTLELMVDEALDLQNLSENELYLKLGTILENNGFVATNDDDIVREKFTFNKSSNLKSLISFHSDESSSAQVLRTDEGRRFFENIKEKVLNYICTNKVIYNWMDGDSVDLKKEAIKKMVSAALLALNVNLAGWLVSAIVIAIAILLKMGYNHVCQPIWDIQGKPQAE